MAIRTVHRTCNLCEATCGLDIEVDGDRIIAARGDPNDPFSRGYCCPKGVAIGALHHDPDRLQRPLVRKGSKLVEASWEEAYAAASEGMVRAITAHGKHAFAHLVGNPVVHNIGALYGMQILRFFLSTKNRYSSNSQDANPHLVANYAMFGAQLVHPVPDLDRTDLLVIVGANPLASQGSLLTAPGVGGRLRAIQKRGGRVWVIDPRRTETARLACRHLAITPGMDAALFLALAHVMVAEGLVDRARLAPLYAGLDGIEAVLAPFTPERVAPRLGPDLGPDMIREVARALATTPRAAVYGRLGICLSRYAGLAAWGLNLVNALAGNIDREGGLVFAEGPVDQAVTVPMGRGSFDRYRSPQGMPEVGGEYPCAILADQIERGLEDPKAPEAIHALLTQSMNPVLSAPNGPRIERALERVEHLVAVDIYLSETARLAHVVLPPRSTLYDMHFDLVFPQLAVEQTGRVSPPVLPAPADAPPSEFEILQRVTLDTFARLPSRLRPLWKRAAAAFARRLDERRLTDWLIRTGPWGRRWNPFGRGLDLARLEAFEHGLPTRPHRGDRLRSLLRRTGRAQADLAPGAFVADTARLASDLDAAREPSSALALINRRHLKSNNSWLHNLAPLASPSRACTLLVHPQDGAARGLVDGGLARLRTVNGEVEATVELSDDMLPGVVSLPHGWGHQQHAGRVARAQPGVNANALTCDRIVDPLTGTAGLFDLQVEVEPIDAPASAAPSAAAAAAAPARAVPAGAA